MKEIDKAIKTYKDFREYEKWFRLLSARYKETRQRKGVEEFREILTKDIADGKTVRMDLLRESYILTAPDNFDDFMIAMEWDRVPSARFWLPRRNILEGKFHIASKLQSFMEDPNEKFLSLSCPPAVGKTTLIKFLLAFIAGKFPMSANMYSSYSKGMTDMMYASLISMMTSDEYNFKEIFNLKKPLCSAEYSTISFRGEGDFPTLGLVAIGGSVTGRTRANKFFITDDLVKNDEVARSIERLETLWSDYQNTLTTRMIGDGVKQIMLGTIWSIHDPISKMKNMYENSQGYEFICLPVEDGMGHSNFNYDHPDRYTDEMIADLKQRLDPVVFSCVYMQQGVEKEGMPFTWDQLKYYNGVLPDGEPDNIVLWGDVAWGGGDSFSAPIVYIYGDQAYIHDVLFDRRDKTITKPRLVGKILENHVMIGRLEANNGGAEMADDITKMLKEHNYSMNFGSKKALGNVAKLSRIQQHQQAIRDFYYRSDQCRSPEYQRFMSELMSFSFTTKNVHDDAPDSLAGLCQFLYGGRQNVITIGKRFF